jgi:hypothetical protein
MGRIPDAREDATIGEDVYAADTLGAGAAKRCESPVTEVAGIAVAYI